MRISGPAAVPAPPNQPLSQWVNASSWCQGDDEEEDEDAGDAGDGAIWGIMNSLASSTALVWGIEDGKSPIQLRTYGAERVQHPI